MGKKLLLATSLCLALASCIKDDTAPAPESSESQTGQSTATPEIPIMPDDEAAINFDAGFWVVNEDWFGHDAGSINRFRYNADGGYTPVYRAFRSANPGKSLGTTTQFAVNWGGNIYFCSKQGARFVVANGKSLKSKLSLGRLGNLGGDARAFVGVTPTKGYISSSTGVAVFDIRTMTVGKTIFTVPTLPGPFPGRPGQPEDVIGNMCMSGGRVFVLGEKNLFVVDTATDQLIQKIAYPKRFKNAMARAKDGSVWVAANNRLVKIDPATLEQTEVPFDTSLTIKESWGAWNDGHLCASTQNNTLYWTTGTKEAGYSIVRFDVETQTAEKIHTLAQAEDGSALMKFYGAALRVDPRTDRLVATVMPYDKTVTDRAENWIYVLSADGQLLNKFEYFGDKGTAGVGGGRYYWFPAMPLFDDAAPRVLLNQVTLKAGESREIDLTEKVVDPDNDWNTVATEVSEPDPRIATITRDGDKITVAAVGTEGQNTSFTVAVESNGVRIVKRIRIHITK